ncbi:single-stranded DNA-binding protein, partial [Lactobacillus kefiranofaciens]|nr:single-stranded DNA-binding protein [Lactobacillus kefiranofaciens]
MLNRAVLTGRLTRDVDLRYTQSGTAVGSFSLAVDRQFTNQQGEREADFINCVIWRKSAENFANFVHKGSLVGIDGRIQTRNYENAQGQRVYVTEVVVENFALLE